MKAITFPGDRQLDIIEIPDPKGGKKKIPVAMCVLTNENVDERWVLDNAAQVAIAKIAKAVYDHYAADGGK